MSRILLVDDEPGIRLTLSEMLKDEGHVVTTAENGRAALEALQEHPADILLTDISMPVIDGIALAREVATSRPETTIILFTGQGTLENATAALRLGVFDYLLKPVHKKELMESVSRAEQVRALARGNRELQQENDTWRQELETRVRAQSEQLAAISGRLLVLQDSLRASLVPHIREGIGVPLRELLKLAGPAAGSAAGAAFTKAVAGVLEATLRPFGTREPEPGEETSLTEALKAFLQAHPRKLAGTTVDPLLEPAPAARIHVYHALREAAGNALLHSGADRVDITSERADGRILYRVTDNGHGFSGEELVRGREHKGGLGLLLIEERTRLAGGSFSLVSGADSGTVITLSIPDGTG